METVLHDLLRNSARRRPSDPAICLPDATLNYAELEERSNQVARALRERGCRIGDRIALLSRKSIEAYVGLYGILKAGCAYVPLDSRAPLERLAYIIGDCEVRAIVTSPGIINLAQELSDRLPVAKLRVALGEDAEGRDQGSVVGQNEISSQDPSPPNVDVVDTDLAYILYTSGSTGVPKGVMISHLNALTFVRWSSGYADLAPGDRVSGHAPLHFDLSIFDVFATARSGGTLFPVPEGTSTFPARQAAWMIENDIMIWYSVPSALSMLARLPGFTDLSFPALRTVIFAGEVFPAEFLRAWVRQVPEATFFNWYGPTETNVVTAYTVQGRLEDLDRPVPIGPACENTHVFLENELGEQVCSPGEVAEICVRGSCVAAGYWGDHESTERSFVPNTHHPWLKDKVYRTGDLGSLDVDGNFLYHGRRDHQIKSRGYRIEIGDIEAALNDVAEIAEAVVVPLPDDVVGNRLIAVVALKDGTTIGRSDILGEVAKVLPRYMVPEAVRIQATLPKTSTGKTDRQALQQSLTAD